MANVQKLVDDLAFELGRCVRVLSSTRQIIAESSAFLDGVVINPSDPSDPGTPPVVQPVAMASLGALILADKPLSYWDMQGPAGMVSVSDRGTAQATLQLKGGGWTADAPQMRLRPYGIGRIAYASELQGAYATASGSYDLGGGFTFEAWVSPPNWNWMQTLLQLYAGTTSKLTIEHTNNDGWYVNGSKVGDTPLNPEKLHHFMVTITGAGAVTLFWDGAKVGSGTGAKLSGVADTLQMNGGFTSRPSLSTPYAHVAVYGKALADTAAKARYDAGTGASVMPRIGTYNVQSTDPVALFAANNRAKPFYGDPTKFRTSTWWGAVSSAAEVQAEKDAGSQAMVVVTENTAVAPNGEDVDWYRQAGMYAIPVINPPSDHWKNPGHTASAKMYASDRTVATVTEDEVSLAGTVQDAITYLSADLAKVPADVAAWTNHGFDMFWRPRDDMAKILNVKSPSGRQHQIQGADYYTHSTDDRIRAEFGQKIGVFPSGTAADDAKAMAMAGKLRHCWASYENVRTLRAAYDHPVLHQAFIGLGHANAITGGMPTGNEVRGDFWASIIAGAQTVSWFYHSFPDCPGWWSGLNASRSSRLVYSYKESNGTVRYWRPKVEKTDPTLPPPSNAAQWEQVPGMYLAWDATYAHKQDDTVIRNGKFWTAVRKPTLGKAPEVDLYDDATDAGAWVSWDFQAQGLRALSVSAAPGMTRWVKKSSAEANKLAQLIHKDAADLALAGNELVWRYWPNTAKVTLPGDSTPYAYVAVMQGYDRWSGTYQVNVPSGVAAVEVLADLDGAAPVLQQVQNGRVAVTFAKECDVRFLRWAVDGSTTVTPPQTGTLTRALIGHIGDSLTAQAGEQLISLGYSSGAGFPKTALYAKFDKRINEPDSAGKTTVQNIRDLRAANGEPNLWVIALGTNMTDEGSGSTAAMAAAVDAVLAEIDKAGPKPVMWVNVGTQWSYPHNFHLAVNAMLAQKMAARGKYGYLADWWTYNRDHRPDGNAKNSWYEEGTHMTTQGYQVKWGQWAPDQVNAFIAAKWGA